MAEFVLDLKWQPHQYKTLLVTDYQAIKAVADSRNNTID